MKHATKNKTAAHKRRMAKRSKIKITYVQLPPTKGATAEDQLADLQSRGVRVNQGMLDAMSSDFKCTWDVSYKVAIIFARSFGDDGNVGKVQNHATRLGFEELNVEAVCELRKKLSSKDIFKMGLSEITAPGWFVSHVTVIGISVDRDGRSEIIGALEASGHILSDDQGLAFLVPLKKKR